MRQRWHDLRDNLPQRAVLSVLCVVTILWLGVAQAVVAATHTPMTLTAADTTALERSWLFQSAFSDLETHDGEPARWLIAQPKQSYALLNRQFALPLAHYRDRFGQLVGSPSWDIVSIRLQSPAAKQLMVTGENSTLSFRLSTGTRNYHLLATAPFSPTQTRIVPITDLNFDRYGFSTDQFTTADRDARALIVDFRWLRIDTYAPWWAQLVVWVITLIPALFAWGVWLRTRQPLDALLGAVAVGYPWLGTLTSGAAPTIEPIITVVLTGALLLTRRSALRLGLLSGHQRTPAWVIAGLASTFGATHALAVSDWMLGVDFSQLPTFASFGAYLAQQRAAFPIPLLTSEYLATRSRSAALMDIGMLTVAVRYAALAGVLAGLSGAFARLRGATGVRAVLALCVCTGIAFVARYADRNYWMAYDPFLGLGLVTIFRCWRSPLSTPAQWFLLGSAICLTDSLRPFLMLFTPALIVAAGWICFRRGRWRALSWLALPVALTVGWHCYHIIVLGEWSWSNYAGFNVARAWAPDAYVRAVQQLPPDMNSPVWGTQSAALIAVVRTQLVAHPVESFLHAVDLLWQMLRIPVEFARFNASGETYVVKRDIPWWVLCYRGLVMTALAIQLASVIVLIRRRPLEWQLGLFERVIWITILCLTAISETGEQARFVASIVPVIVYGITDVLPLRLPNALFVTADAAQSTHDEYSKPDNL